MSWFRIRSNILLVFFILLLMLLIIRLFVITGIEGGRWTASAEENMIRTVSTDAPRGQIYDRNGVLLAGNRSTFAINFSRNDLSSERTNVSASKLIGILEKHSISLIDGFPIVIDNRANLENQIAAFGIPIEALPVTGEEIVYYFTFDLEIVRWLASQSMPLDYTAEQAFNELRRRCNIPEGLDALDAQSELLELGVTLPISVQRMEYTYEREKRDFLDRYKIVDGEDQWSGIPDAETAFKGVRNFYGLSESGSEYREMTTDQIRKILIIRYALTSQGYLRYMPVKIASGISKEAVVEIEENLQDLEGVEVVTESVRYYPQGHQASHLIGYLGRISDTPEEKSYYIDDKGYNPAELIGKDGVEASMEDILHGEDGLKQIQVNSSGELMRVIGEEKKAKKGEDIALTIDIRLHEVAYNALEQTMTGIQTNTPFQSQYGTFAWAESKRQAQVGAAVVLNVKTGEPLAITSYPDFDPNIFAEGITAENWASLQGTNPRDPLAPRPLYNVAALTAVQPGSTFKPMTAITALESGMTSTRTVYDGHAVSLGDHVYSCMGYHGNVDLFRGLERSCNFYFFDLATGRDWARGGTDLGYADNISIDKITSYAEQFGLGVASGAEIPETAKGSPTAEKKMSSTKTLLENYLYSQAEYLFEPEVLKNPDSLEQSIKTIIGWAEENPPIREIKARMQDLGVKSSEVTSIAETCKYTYFNYAQWTEGDAFNIAIGQGEAAFTPLQMANYFATIGNGGYRNSLSLIKATEIEGEVVRPQGTQAAIADPQHLKDVITGLRRAVTSGTMSRGMAGLSIPVAGKSGTAQRAGYINPPDEVAYIKENLHRINGNLDWASVEAEMNRLLTEYPNIYPNANIAVRRAVINLSGRNFSSERIDAYKNKYEDFAWIVALAPADDPEIAVACLIVQGGSSSNAEPVVRELIGKYFEFKAADEAEGNALDYKTFFSEDHREGVSYGGILGGSGG